MKDELTDAILKRIKSRIGDYEKHDITKERDQLIEIWKRYHPKAAEEQSAYLHPLLCLVKRTPATKDPEYKNDSDEEWANDVYRVSVRRWKVDKVFGTDEGMIQIGISAHDGTARHDWREFQMIKNQIAGSECEGFELYPAESRLLDPSNYYTLWCFPGIKRLKIGLEERRVLDQNEALAPQRSFPKSERSL